jgi:UDP-N-acetyl-D-mannosaminuronic acid transferase (WecB/TagA/CpsF family)
VEVILDVYSRQHFAIVDYLYFANISGKKLFETHDAHYNLSDFQNALLSDYTQTDIQLVRKAYQDAIHDAELVLPDGIALQIFYFLARKKRLNNLNGTDFAPHLLEQAMKKYGSHKIRILLYGTYPDLLVKTKVFLENR